MAPEGCVPCMASGDFSAITSADRCVSGVSDCPCTKADGAPEIPVQRQVSRRGSYKKYGVKAVQGARSYMEDTHVAMSKFMSFKCANKWRISHPGSLSQRVPLQLYGVFDGHGGAAVAEHCADTLPKRLYDCIKTSVASQVAEQHQIQSSFGAASSASRPVDVADVVGHTLHDVIPNAMETAFRDTDESLREGTVAAWTGTTAIVAVVGLTSIWIANCGDSRAVLCHQGTAMPLSKDHKPSCPAEAERIARTGGVVVHNYGRRVMGVLSVSRAIGDHSFQQYGVSAEPEIQTVERRTGDEFLLLASDGLWEVMSNEDAIQLARRCFLRAKSRGAGPGAAARISANVLIRVALGRGSGDNITVLVVDLTADGEQQDASPACTASKWSSGSLGSEDGSNGGDDVVEGVLRVSGSGSQEGSLRQRDTSHDEESKESGGSEECSPDEEVGTTAETSNANPAARMLGSEISSPKANQTEPRGPFRLSPAERSYSSLTQISDGGSSDGEQHSSNSEPDDTNAAAQAAVTEPQQPDSACPDTKTCDSEHKFYRPALSPFADHSWQQDASDADAATDCSSADDESHSPKQGAQSPAAQYADLSVTSPFYLHPYSPTASPAADSSTLEPSTCTFSTRTDNTFSRIESDKSISPFAAGPVSDGPCETDSSSAWAPWHSQSNTSTSPFSLPPGADSPFELGPCPGVSDQDLAVFGDLSYAPGQYSSSSTSSKMLVSSGEQLAAANTAAHTPSQTLNATPAADNVVGGSKHTGHVVADKPIVGPSSKTVARKQKCCHTSPFAAPGHTRGKGFTSIQIPSHCSSPFWLEQEARSTELQHKATSLPSPTAMLTAQEARAWEADMQLFRSLRLDHSSTAHALSSQAAPSCASEETGMASRKKEINTEGSAQGDVVQLSGAATRALSTLTAVEMPECLEDDDREYSLGYWLHGNKMNTSSHPKIQGTTTQNSSPHTISASDLKEAQAQLDHRINKMFDTDAPHEVDARAVALDRMRATRPSKSDSADLEWSRGKRITVQKCTYPPVELSDCRNAMGASAHDSLASFLSLRRFGSSGLELMLSS